VDGPSSAQITSNTISGNISGPDDTGHGGGIAIINANSPVVANNRILNNIADLGGGLWFCCNAAVSVTQNLFAGNWATDGGGAYVFLLSGESATLVNNTISRNNASQGSGIFIFGYAPKATLFNNLVIGVNANDALYCEATVDGSVFTSNDVYDGSSSPYGGTCSNQTGLKGNLSADPLFISKTNYKLQATSPAINAGSNSAPNLPAKDLANRPRIVGGTIDMGAYEYQ
jgi:hypothetical protein